MYKARRSLATSGYHPSAWGSFVIFGHPDAPFTPSLDGIKTNLVWTTSLCRFIATGASLYLDATRQQLYNNSQLSVEQIESIDAALTAFVARDSNFFEYKRLEQSSELMTLDAEGYLAYWTLLAIGYLRFGKEEDNGNAEKQRHELLGSLLTAQRLLCDSYVRIALVIEVTKLRGVYPLDNEEGRMLLRSGIRALHWLNADGSLLKEANETLSAWMQSLENSVVLNIQDIAGVDAETFRKADAGDRQAQKQMLRNLWTRQASIKAITSSLPWTDWMLRMIGCSGSEQTISDLLGVIDSSYKKGGLSEIETKALNRLLEQYVGHDEVDEATVQNVLTVFAKKAHESKVLDLFIICDHLASGEREVSISEIQRAIQLAKDLNSPGAEMYFTGVWCQRVAQLGLIEVAINKAWDVLSKCEELAAQDSEYADRVGVTALLSRQLCQMLNDMEAVEMLDANYMDAMQGYLSKQGEMRDL